MSATIPFGTLYVAPAAEAFLRRKPALTIELNLTDVVIDLVATMIDVAIWMGTCPTAG